MPNPGDEVTCSDCDQSFTIPHPPTDTIHIPKCPHCDSIVDGYEDRAEYKQYLRDVDQLCEGIEEELDDLINQMQRTRHDIPPGSQAEALKLAANRLEELAKRARSKVNDSPK